MCIRDRLYDSVGSRSLNRNVLKKLTDVGGKVGEFFPSWLKLININMNFRNHRKIVVIDLSLIHIYYNGWCWSLIWC